VVQPHAARDAGQALPGAEEARAGVVVRPMVAEVRAVAAVRPMVAAAQVAAEAVPQLEGRDVAGEEEAQPPAAVRAVARRRAAPDARPALVWAFHRARRLLCRPEP
jgi:hypothetical protein